MRIKILSLALNSVFKFNKLVGIALFCILIFSCKSPFSPDIKELLSFPEEVEINGRIYTLETSLGRDLMPGRDPDGGPLIAVVWITAADQLQFPSNLDANRLWIINGQEVWETEFSYEERPQDPNRKHQLEKIARDGPKWGPNIYVDVVVRIIDHNNRAYFLKASNQYIGGAY